MIQQAQMVQSLPMNVMQQAEQYQLGSLLGTYKPQLSHPLAIIGLIVGAWVLDIIVIAVAASFGYILYFTIFLPIIALIYGIRAMFHYNVRVYHFNAGLIKTKGQQFDVIRWDQVEAVWQKITKSRYSTSYTYTVQRTDHKTFIFNSILRQIALLGQNIMQEVTKIQMPRAMEAYNAGHTLNFGTLAISSYGINNGKEQLSWDQLENVALYRGYLVIKKIGKKRNWEHVAVASIPNYTVLLGIISYARSGQR